MIKIAFHEDQIGIRGTTVALYDYANYNEEILKNESLILIPKRKDKNKKHDILGLLRICKRFPVRVYNDIQDMERILQEEKCSILYCIKYGVDDGVHSRIIKTVVHCVFDMSQPHGDVYAGVSKSIAKKYYQPLFVPHMIGLRAGQPEDNLREQLNIPKNCKVFGRYGGMDTFNILFCWQVIAQIVQERKDIFFLFINTPEVVKNTNIIYLNKITEEKDKNRFINTCDAYLECGTLGHSFGLAIGEFSINNKPIIAYSGEELWNREHMSILEDKGLYFQNPQEFYNILTNFDTEMYKAKDNNCYKKFTPELVMEQFKRVFID